MNKALLGALALGVGSNFLFPKKNPNMPQQADARTPGIAGNIQNSVQKGLQKTAEDLPGQLVNRGVSAFLGLNDGGRIGADTFGSPAQYKADGGRMDADMYGSPAVYREGGGGLWQGLQDIMAGKHAARAAELNEINKALGIEGQMEATTDQARLMAERQAIINEVLGRNKPAPQAAPQAAPQLGAPVTAQAGGSAPVDPNLLMEPIGGYTDPKDRLKAAQFLMTPMGPEASLFNEGGIAIKKGNEGKFTAKANSAGMGVQEYARKVLNAPEGRYDPATRKQANFARNASAWHKEDGGRIGPLAKTTHTTKDGDKYEMNFHNPMAGLTGGSKDKEA